MKKETIKKIEEFLDLNLDEFISKHIFSNEKNIDEILKKIQNKFDLKNYPYKIVCLDISHINGKNPVGGLSAMLGGFLTKKEYRQFKIPKELGGDDYESLLFCINKYFKNNTTDLFILDGWKWQLNIVNKLDKNILKKVDFISIGKWKARKRKGKISWDKEIFFLPNEKEIKVNYNNFEDKLLIKLRDESHRFANRYRKNIQSKLINKK